MSKIRLFVELKNSEMFHYYDTPKQKCVKADDTHYISPSGSKRIIHPHVAVFTDKPERKDESIYTKLSYVSRGDKDVFGRE